MKKKKNSSTGMSLVTWLVAAGVASGFMALILIAAMNQDFLKSKDLEPLLIQAPKTAVKTRPQEPTGMQIPNRDKKVFDLLADGKPAPAPKPVAKVEKKVQKVEKPAPKKVAPKKIAKAVEKPVQKTKSTPAPKPVVEKKPASKPAPKAVSGAYGVQLASFRDEATAASAAKKLQNKYADELGGLATYIERADLGAKGIYYRVKFRGISSADVAKKVCASLKSKGQSCLYGRY